MALLFTLFSRIYWVGVLTSLGHAYTVLTRMAQLSVNTFQIKNMWKHQMVLIKKFSFNGKSAEHNGKGVKYRFMEASNLN